MKKQMSIKKKAKNQSEIDEENQNILQEVLKIIDFLFEARLIQKISRPIDKRVREDFIDKYAMKLQSLHGKLNKIRIEVVEMTYSQTGNGRNKSVFGEATNKPDDWKKVIRNIESRYIEVLVDGSFKYFRKISYALGLMAGDKRMEIINIEEWASSCLDSKGQDMCC